MASRQKTQHLAGNGSGHSGHAWLGRLSTPEQALLRFAETGKEIRLPVAAAQPDDQKVDFEAMPGWGEDRTIRADVLRHLLVEPEWPVNAKGVRLRGARIIGTLDLQSATLKCPLDLRDCYLERPVLLDYATVSLLQLIHCWLAGFRADLLIVTKELDLSRSMISGTVRLLGADITGQLSCRGAQLNGNLAGSALVADRMTVRGNVLLDYGFTAAAGVRLPGAKITGQLSCRDAQITGTDSDGDALIADEVTVGGEVFLDRSGPDQVGFTTAGAVRLPHASITGRLNCRGATIAGDQDGNAFFGDRLTIGGDVLLIAGFTAAGAVRLPGASIKGRLNCRGATITGSDIDGNSLFAFGLTVSGDALFDDLFATHGAVRLPGASIAGQLKCGGAQIKGADIHGNALFADKITAGGILLDDGFTAAGAVRLPGASIAGQLSCRNAHITGRDKDGDALMADRITVSGGVFLDKGFSAAGAVRLMRARVTGQLSCGGALITRPNKLGNALAADEVTVGSDVLLDDGFRAAGGVQLSGARIDGCLSLDDATLDDPVALIAEGATIGQRLVWAPRRAVTGMVSLERTRVHRLDDDWRVAGANWPGAAADGRLRLAGFIYDGFGGERRASAAQRLDWIRGQHRKPMPGKAGSAGKPGSFDTQPYEQLASVYRQAGRDTEARQVAIAQRNDLRTYAALARWRRLGNWLLDVTIKHGYQPLRAVVMLLAVYLVALGLFWGAQHQPDAMVPSRDTSSASKGLTALDCSKAYPCFSPAGFAMDVTIPIIKTGQSDNWRPNAAADFGWVYLWGTWVFTGLGWAFTTLAVAGYTGMIRKD